MSTVSLLPNNLNLKLGKRSLLATFYPGAQEDRSNALGASRCTENRLKETAFSSKNTTFGSRMIKMLILAGKATAARMFGVLETSVRDFDEKKNIKGSNGWIECVNLAADMQERGKENRFSFGKPEEFCHAK